MQVHNLISTLDYTAANHLTGAARDAVRNEADFLRRLERFELPLIPQEAAVAEEIAATCRTLREHDMFRLPYRAMYVETQLFILPEEVLQSIKEGEYPLPKEKIRFGCVFMEMELDQLPPELQRRVVDTGKTHHMVAKPYVEIAALKDNAPPWARVFTTDIDESVVGYAQNREPLSAHTSVGAAPVVRQMFNEGIQITFEWMMFLLNAQGVSRAHYAAPEKLNRARLKSNKEPVYGYTQVLLPNWRARREEDRAAGGVVEERKRPRLHWRRGHMRQQRIGSGRELTKAVFIKPVMVGHEAEGEVFHLQYGQALPK